LKLGMIAWKLALLLRIDILRDEGIILHSLAWFCWPVNSTLYGIRCPSNRQNLPKYKGKFGIASQIWDLTEERHDSKPSKFSALYHCPLIA
jgi:hypothetical protein